MSAHPSPPVLRDFIDKLLTLDRALQLPGNASGEHDFIEKLLVTVDAAPVLLAYVDGSERYRFCNQTYERWFGVPRERVIGRTAREVLGGAAYASLREDIQAALSGQRRHFEREVPYRTGGTRLVSADYLPHVLPDGRIAGYVGMVTDVTDLRRGEEAERIAAALRESEDRLRLILVATELGTWDVDFRRGQMRWDERCRELCGQPPGMPFTHESFLGGVHSDDRARVADAVRAALAPSGNGAYHAEYRTVDARTGEERWLVAHGQAFLDARREPVRFIGTVRDHTESHVARARAQRLCAVASALSHALLPEEVAAVVVREGAAALEARTASLALVSEDGTAFELAASHGFPEGLMEGWRRFPLDTPVMFREAWRTGQPVLYETLERFLRDYPEQEGSPALLGRAFAAIPLRVRGRTLGAFGFSFERERAFAPEELQFMEAIGHQCSLAIERARLYAAERQARAEAERLRDALDAERARLEAVLRQLPVGVLITAPDGRMVMGNTAIDAILRRPEGTPLSMEQWPLERSLRDGVTVVREPVTLVQEDGARTRLELSSAPVRDAEGRTVAGVVVATDVTAHHELQEALRREADVREKLLGIVSHDLRGPLQAIITSVQLLLRSQPLTAAQERSARRIQTSTGRMSHLIRDLLDFARVRQGGTLPLHARPIRLEDACRNAVDELLAAWPQRLILLDVRGTTFGEWDPDRMEQLVGNLVANALTHGAEGTPVEVRLQGEAEALVLEVANAGNPIPPTLLGRIFEPFTRASSEGDAFKGVGLGLFIVQEIVTAHGGSIQVSSSAEQGTVFRVTLPRRAPA